MPCTPSGNGSFILIKVDSIVGLGDRNSSPTINRATFEANSKGEPKFNCYEYDRLDTTWSFEIKVPVDSQDALYSKIEDHMFDGTTGSVEWGPFNNTMYAAEVLFQSIAPAVAQGTLVTTAITAQTTGAISRTRLS